jgi:putative transposase
MVAFIDQHRDTYGVEPICAVPPIAPSSYFLRNGQQQDATKRLARVQRDEELRAAMQQVWDASGVRSSVLCAAGCNILQPS